MIRQTHTYAICQVSERVYSEVREKLDTAGYQHTFHEGPNESEVIDMSGIALQIDPNIPVDVGLPWMRPALRNWSIVGMNHYFTHVPLPGSENMETVDRVFYDGKELPASSYSRFGDRYEVTQKHLFVAMTRYGRCIQAEGMDQMQVFDELERQAKDIDDAAAMQAHWSNVARSVTSDTGKPE